MFLHGQANQPPDKYGTFDNICVYQMRGEDFLRKASSLTGDGERVKTEAAFKKTMTLAGQLAVASRLAAAVGVCHVPGPFPVSSFPCTGSFNGQAIRLLGKRVIPSVSEGAVLRIDDNHPPAQKKSP